MPVEFDFVWSTRYFPVYPVSVSPALSCLDVLIKDYYLSLCPRLRVPVPPSCVHRDTDMINISIESYKLLLNEINQIKNKNSFRIII